MESKISKSEIIKCLEAIEPGNYGSFWYDLTVLKQITHSNKSFNYQLQWMIEKDPTLSDIIEANKNKTIELVSISSKPIFKIQKSLNIVRI